MKKALVAALAAASVAAVAVAVAWADDSTSVIHACVSKGSGVVRVRATGDTCGRHETALDWNAQGPQGPAGDQGAAGPTGPAGPAGPAGSASSTEPNARVVGFLRVDGANGTIDGDSTDAKHPKWITVLGFDTDTSVENAVGSATGGAGAGKVDTKPFVITKSVDAASPQLYQALVTGERLDHVELDLVLPDGPDGKAVDYAVTLSNALVSDIHQFDTGTSDGHALEQVSFVYQKIEIKSSASDGSPSSTSGWDITTNSQS
jgi:type VI secretion system Hcp family effector